MSLEIDRFVARCQIPGRVQQKSALVDDVGRRRFALECAAQLNSRWPSQNAVVRIRLLKVRLVLKAEQFEEASLVRAWVEAFIRALFVALISPAAGGNVVRTESRAAWMGQLILDVLSGTAQNQWQYHEFSDILRHSPAEAVLLLLGRDPSELVNILHFISDHGALEAFLALFDEAAIERLYVIHARALGGANASPLALEELSELAQLILREASVLPRIRTIDRKSAVRVFMRSVGKGPGDHGLSADWSFRRVFHGLKALAAAAQATTQGTLHQENEWWRSFKETHPHPAVLDVLERMRLTTLPKLETLLPQLGPLLLSDSPVTIPQTERWISSDYAGLLLITRMVERLDWAPRILTAFGAVHGQQILHSVLAGVGLCILDKFEVEEPSLEPGVALFAGWMECPDLGGFKRFLASQDDTSRATLLRALLSSNDQDRGATWKGTFDSLGECLVMEFAAQVRGFRRSSRPFIVKRFLAQPGRIAVAEKRLVVQLAPNPLHVALRLSGMDYPLPALTWLGGREVYYQLEGL